MVLVQKWPFFQLFFFRNISQKHVFNDILERKPVFLGYKNKKFKKSKNWNFSKGVNPFFWFKNGLFLKLFFLGNIGQENEFYDILDRKNAFLAYINNKFKKSKNSDFSKGLTHGFDPKIIIFSTFIFWQNKPKKNVLYNILELKKTSL